MNDKNNFKSKNEIINKNQMFMKKKLKDNTETLNNLKNIFIFC